MHVLIIKMSSMGDVLHTLPAITDAMNAIPNCRFDWVVEPAFADIPRWHPAVSSVIELPLRAFRKHPLQTIKTKKINTFTHQLKEKKYDMVIDAQGLLKSAIITKLANGPSHGLDKHSARESISHFFYTHRHGVAKDQHAIARTRQLFASALNYPVPASSPDFHIDINKLPNCPIDVPNQFLVFCHGTTWPTKLYPDQYWSELLKKADDANLTVYLPWGNETEKIRAENLSRDFKNAIVLPKLTLSDIAKLLSLATAVISVDTGLGHLSAALNTPTISLYGATDPKRVGALGKRSIHLIADFPCSPCVNKSCVYAKQNKTDITTPCYTSIKPDIVWEALKTTSAID